VLLKPDKAILEKLSPAQALELGERSDALNPQRSRA
jgi:hypothetical protein